MKFDNEGGIASPGPARQGDVLMYRFVPRPGSVLEQWCLNTMKILDELAANNPFEGLYERMRDLARERGPLEYAKGEHSGHVHTTVPGDLALGIMAGATEDPAGPSVGIKSETLPLSVIHDMMFCPTKDGREVGINLSTIQVCTVVAAKRPFGVYHIQTEGKSSTTFEVKELTEANKGEHGAILLTEGFWMMTPQVKVDVISKKLERVCD